jgi:hypothetical protein
MSHQLWDAVYCWSCVAYNIYFHPFGSHAVLLLDVVVVLDVSDSSTFADNFQVPQLLRLLLVEEVVVLGVDCCCVTTGADCAVVTPALQSA